MADKRRIVVIGAGYAGLLATVRLAGKTRRHPVDMTLVNATGIFVERLRLHHYAANQAVRQQPIPLLPSKIEQMSEHLFNIRPQICATMVQAYCCTARPQ